MIDPIALSRDIGRGHDLRRIATQSTYREIAEDVPDPLLRDALLRWVHELLQTRIGADLAKDEAEALARVDDRFKKDPPRTFAEAHRALVVAATPQATHDALVRLADLAPPIAAVRKERRARRSEATKRLGFTVPFADASVATKLLDATEGITADLRKRARITTAAQAIHHGFARDAAHGWPAHLSGRSLEDFFDALVPRKFESPPLPDALSGTSFVRAAAKWGHALRVAGTARSLPFVLARDPYPVDAYRFGAVLALAIVDPIFQKKKLGLSARAAASQARTLRIALLSAVRVLAVRHLLARDSDAFEELTARAFGTPLPRALRDAWPDLRADEHARFVAMLAAPAFARDLVDRFDEDWFANPKAGIHLAGIAAGPVFVAPGVPLASLAGPPSLRYAGVASLPLELDERVAENIGRAFERALG